MGNHPSSAEVLTPDEQNQRHQQNCWDAIENIAREIRFQLENYTSQKTKKAIGRHIATLMHYSTKRTDAYRALEFINENIAAASYDGIISKIKPSANVLQSVYASLYQQIATVLYKEIPFRTKEIHELIPVLRRSCPMLPRDVLDALEHMTNSRYANGNAGSGFANLLLAELLLS